MSVINGLAFDLTAQNVVLRDEKCDSVEIEAIYPGLFTVVDISTESYEKIYESKKRNIVIRDSIFIKSFLDSICSNMFVKKHDGIDVRGKISCHLSNGEKAVFYVGQWRIQYKNDVYWVPYYLFELLYLPFKDNY